MFSAGLKIKKSWYCNLHSLNLPVFLLAVWFNRTLIQFYPLCMVLFLERVFPTCKYFIIKCMTIIKFKNNIKLSILCKLYKKCKINSTVVLTYLLITEILMSSMFWRNILLICYILLQILFSYIQGSSEGNRYNIQKENTCNVFLAAKILQYWNDCTFSYLVLNNTLFFCICISVQFNLSTETVSIENHINYKRISMCYIFNFKCSFSINLYSFCST
jgi:hypothetical protein